MCIIYNEILLDHIQYYTYNKILLIFTGVKLLTITEKKITG